MNINFEHINPTFHEHEGYTFLEWQGEFYKGCKRCGGSGHFSFNGEHSICYECGNGSAKLGAQLDSREAAEQWCHGKAMAQARRDRKREEERLAKVAKAEANQAALKAADPEVYEFLMGIVIEDDTQDQYETYEDWAQATGGQSSPRLEKDSFLRAMAETLRWVGPSKPFTDNMVAAVRRSMERRQHQAAESAAHPAPAGRVAVTGTIASTKVVDGEYGTTFKILVKDDRGFKVWVSLPRAQYDEVTVGLDWDPEYTWFSALKGKRITFTAGLTPSHDDPAFAFGSRPTKGAWL
jgi:hypothetical protein